VPTKRLDDDGWPRDPRLDPFRDAVWELSLHGRPVAYLTTQVVKMRTYPVPWGRKEEQLWFQVNWLDGRRDVSDEDYGPGWVVVADLEAGTFEYPDRGESINFDARPVLGEERGTLWDRYGPP
jgi:hypothetical protein